jgi:hypothetical protein
MAYIVVSIGCGYQEQFVYMMAWGNEDAELW